METQTRSIAWEAEVVWGKGGEGQWEEVGGGAEVSVEA
jgi:hypothetical protein